MKNAKKKKVVVRNPFAVLAHRRSGSGSHGDKRKQESKRACRKFRYN